MDRMWVAALFLFSSAFFVTLTLALFVEMGGRLWRRRQIGRRLRPVLDDRNGASRRPDVHELIRADADGPGGGVVSATAALFPPFRDLSILLEQSRAGWGPLTFLVVTAGASFGLGGAVLLLLRSLPLSLVAAVAGALVPYIALARRRTARFKQFEEEFPEAIDLLGRAIRAGHPLVAGIRMVAEEGPPEVALEFRRTFEEQRYGLPFEEALLGMVDRNNLVDVRIFAIAVLVQREVGGNLAEILEGLSATIRKRFYLRRQLRTYTAQGRMTGWALTVLPIALATILFLLQPDYMMVLFTTLPGVVMVGTAVFLQLVGFLWIRKIIQIDM